MLQPLHKHLELTISTDLCWTEHIKNKSSKSILLSRYPSPHVWTSPSYGLIAAVLVVCEAHTRTRQPGVACSHHCGPSIIIRTDTGWCCAKPTPCRDWMVPKQQLLQQLGWPTLPAMISSSPTLHRLKAKLTRRLPEDLKSSQINFCSQSHLVYSALFSSVTVHTQYCLHPGQERGSIISQELFLQSWKNK